MAAAFQWHFTSVQRQAASLQAAVLAPGADTAIWLMDFKQNVTTPLGPAEGGSWWYATARLQHTVFGLLQVTESAGRVRSRYYGYLSPVHDHSAHLVKVFLSEALCGLPPTTQRLVVWSDCGAHFRTYTLLYFLLVQVVQSHGLQVHINFCGEHHGKGAVDGFFGRLDGFLREFARTQVVANIDDVRLAFEHGAADAMSRDPWVEYFFRTVDPSDAALQAAYRALLPSDSFEVTKTYCMQSRPAPGRLQRAQLSNVASGVLLQNRLFSDRTVGEPVVPAFIEHPADVNRKWRRACRKTEPEKDGVNVATVLARFEAQRLYAPAGGLAGRRLPLEQVGRRLLSQRHGRRLRELSKKAALNFAR